jgi:hypothetical protein
MREEVNANHAHIDLAAFKGLISSATDVGNVWEVRLPSLPWKVGTALRERASLVLMLETAFPSRAIWLSDWASDEQPGWRILGREDQLSSLDEEMRSGAWALFFFAERPSLDELLKTVPKDPPTAVDASHSVQALGASAAIWSWYDNSEWTLVLPSKLELNT